MLIQPETPTTFPRISVVVPTYNEARNLPIVFALMPEVFEVVVVDGRSIDGTVEVARQLRPDAAVTVAVTTAAQAGAALGEAGAGALSVVAHDAY